MIFKRSIVLKKFYKLLSSVKQVKQSVERLNISIRQTNLMIDNKFKVLFDNYNDEALYADFEEKIKERLG